MEDALNSISDSIESLRSPESWDLLIDENVNGSHVKVFRTAAPRWLNFESNRPTAVIIAWTKVGGIQNYAVHAAQNLSQATLIASQVYQEFSLEVSKLKVEVQENREELPY